ncbi:MAG: excinuclease ABC subunit UvrC [Magnetococcales bacterium]|nr:excinuclease ABC subunit UvrC [Magnetococcales bacterium]
MSKQHPIQPQIAALTLKPGVYRYLDSEERVLYVGKAKHLKKRVGSYFTGQNSPRIQAMLALAKGLDITVTDSENEALILEANLIKRFRPPYNILFKDDKSYPYLRLSLEHDFPRLSLHRGRRNQPGRYFGPYPTVSALRETLKHLQSIFPIRQCNDRQFGNRSRPCLQYQIKRCSGPCCGRVESEKYQGWVRDLVLFLEGKDRALEKSLKKRMWEAAEALNFEDAGIMRDQLKFMASIQDQRRLNLSRELDLDVIASLSMPGGTAIQIFFVRQGINLGNRSFFPDNSAGLSEAEVLEAFIAQYYSNPEYRMESGGKSGWPPPEILVNQSLDDSQWLGAALSRLRGGVVHITKPLRGEKRRLIKMAEVNAELEHKRRKSSNNSHKVVLQELQKLLELPQPPERIEAYDISHFQSSEAVASLVVFGSDGFKKNGYRRFIIKDSTACDDTARMAEVLTRRFMQLKQKPNAEDEASNHSGEWPDLVLLDGGVGQLNAVLTVADELQVDGVAFCAIAKGPERNAGRERLFLPDMADPIILPHDSPLLFLLQNIRDESHRFAVGFHRVRRAKSQIKSLIDEVPGVGAKRKRILLKLFGSVSGILEAGVAELSKVDGISEELANNIIHYLQRSK